MLTEEIVEQAADFHGHLGPFLVIGVRMGIVGLNKLSLKQNNKQLSIKASLPLRVPFSCIIDGLQITTKCTIGNQKLSLVNSEKIQAVFEGRDDGRKIAVGLNQTSFEKLKAQLLQEELPDEEVRRLAREVAALPETELFTVV
jgi:formylmethanofuran dehydrogenase subunit E